ncbi:unnamed protein product [Amoebophrya sp. A25]|nr:unnamed protein product [Amoebophrya sp. A25]|eukprot:GSA25T00025508001.1
MNKDQNGGTGLTGTMTAAQVPAQTSAQSTATTSAPTAASTYSQWVKHIFLALGVTVPEKELQLTGMIEEASTDAVFQSLGTVFDLFSTHRATHGSLCLYYLENVLYAHPNALALYFHADLVYSLFASDGDDLRAGVLLWRLLKYKYESSKQTYSCLAETQKVVRLLERRFGTKMKFGNVPPCCLRYTLLKIWTDIPPTRELALGSANVNVSSSSSSAFNGGSGGGSASSSSGTKGASKNPFSLDNTKEELTAAVALQKQKDGLLSELELFGNIMGQTLSTTGKIKGGGATGNDSSSIGGYTSSSSTKDREEAARHAMLEVCLQWLANEDEPKECKIPLLELLRATVKAASATQMTSQLLARFFGLLVSSSGASGSSDGGGAGNIKSTSDDVQFLLAFLDWAELSSILPALLDVFADDKLVAIWTYLCLLHPQPLPELLQMNPTWSFFFEVKQDPLTRFQRVLLQQFFLRNRCLGNSAIAVVLSLMRSEFSAMRALKLFRAIGPGIERFRPYLKQIREEATHIVERIEEKQLANANSRDADFDFDEEEETLDRWQAVVDELDEILEGEDGDSTSTSSGGRNGSRGNGADGRKSSRSRKSRSSNAANPMDQLFEAGFVGSNLYKPAKPSAPIEECFQNAPNPAGKTAFLQQKKLEQDKFLSLFRSGEIGSAATSSTDPSATRLRNNPTSGELNRLFRENIALHHQITQKQMELAQTNLKQWTTLDAHIEEEKRSGADDISAGSPRLEPVEPSTPAVPQPQYRTTIQNVPPGAPPVVQGAADPQLSSICFAHPRCGIRNTNNTCFVNTILQALFHTDTLVSQLLQFRLRPPTKPIDEANYKLGSALLKQLQVLFAMLLVTRRPHVEIEQLLNELPSGEYPKGEQQDAGEFLRFVFDKLGGFEQPLIRHCFAGELNEVTKCQSCHFEKRRPETFTEMILPVPDVAGKSLQSLVDDKLQRQRMSDAVECSRCGNRNQPEVWSEIESPPRNLVIALIRFDFQNGGLVKMKTPIQISPQLRLGQFVYDFYFSVQHCGATADSGHYTALGRRADCAPPMLGNVEGAFWKFDDSSVRPATSADVAKIMSGAEQTDDTPYILFYRCQTAPLDAEPVLSKTFLDSLQKEDHRLLQNLS